MAPSTLKQAIRHAGPDFNESIRGIEVEHQIFTDWRTDTADVINQIAQKPEHQTRFRLIIATLLQVVAVFDELAELHDGLALQQAANASGKIKKRKPLDVR